jgi:hypothetical protein
MLTPMRICVVAALALAVVACSDATATNDVTPNGQPTLATSDLLGTYLLTQFDGMPLPAVRPASVSNGFKQDTVIAGCLVLGPAPGGVASSSADFVNVTWIFAGNADTTFMSGHGECPLFLPADHQYFTWEGSQGTWVFCGTHSCDTTGFKAEWVNGKVVISTGSTARETVYVRE